MSCVVRSSLVIALLGAAFGLGACGGSPPTPSPAVMPASAAYNAGNLEPMVVDWQPEQRGDLETSMRDGVVVIENGANGLRLLRDCRLDGGYSYLGMTRRERVIRLRSQDDVKANLPLGGLGLAARLGGEFDKGATLDIAMVMIGRVRSTRVRVTKEDLRGRCEGATHIVRGATLGAFAVDRGESTHARSAAEIFGVGLGGGTASSSSVRVVDGQLESCGSANPDSARPPSQCGAVIRVELLPLEGAGAAGGPRDLDAVNTCAPPLVRVDGICTRASSRGVAECTYGDAQGCQAACAQGEPVSCWRFGRMLYKGEGGLRASTTDAAQFAGRSCEANEPRGCVLLGIIFYEGKGIPRDLVKAAKLHNMACQAGDADGCSNLGQMLRDGEGVPRDMHLADLALTRGCNGGKSYACNDLGFMALGMSGVKPDHPLAASLFKRACDGDVANACGNLGLMLEFGRGTAQSWDGAVASYQKGCRLDPGECGMLGAVIQQGHGRVRGGPEPTDLFRRACQAGAVSSCAMIQNYIDPQQRLDPARAKAFLPLALDFCRSGLPRSCSSAGVVLLSQGQAKDGRALLERGCSMNDDWACIVSKLPLK